MLNLSGDRAKYWKTLMHIAKKYGKMQIGMKLLPAPPSQRASWCGQAHCAQWWWRRAPPGYLLIVWPKATLCPPQRCGCWCSGHRRAKTLPHHIHQHRGRAESGVQNSVSEDNCVAEKKGFKIDRQPSRSVPDCRNEGDKSWHYTSQQLRWKSWNIHKLPHKDTQI